MLDKEIRIRVENYLEIDLNKRNENGSHSRKREYVYARALYYGLCRELTPLPLNKIGATLDQDHATVLHNIKNTYKNLFFWNEKKYIDVYKDIVNEMKPIKARLKKEKQEAMDYLRLLEENQSLRTLLDSALSELNNEENYIQKYIMAKTQLNYIKGVVKKKQSLSSVENFIKELEKI
jgi:hypothetical protein